VVPPKFEVPVPKLLPPKLPKPVVAVLPPKPEEGAAPKLGVVVLPPKVLAPELGKKEVPLIGAEVAAKPELDEPQEN
jgi:hypothetical protein